MRILGEKWTAMFVRCNAVALLILVSAGRGLGTLVTRLGGVSLEDFLCPSDASVNGAEISECRTLDFAGLWKSTLGLSCASQFLAGLVSLERISYEH